MRIRPEANYYAKKVICVAAVSNLNALIEDYIRDKDKE